MPDSYIIGTLFSAVSFFLNGVTIDTKHHSFRTGINLYSVCIGQPLTMALFYRDYILQAINTTENSITSMNGRSKILSEIYNDEIQLAYLEHSVNRVIS